jgi:hypothetical protein
MNSLSTVDLQVCKFGNILLRIKANLSFGLRCHPHQNNMFDENSNATDIKKTLNHWILCKAIDFNFKI